MSMPQPIPRRVAVYARVSTTRQAEADLSIPDQLHQARAWAERHGHTVVREFIEPGASGTDENRPVFQSMLAEARQKPRPFEIVLVHSLSRFCRDQFTWAITRRALERAGIAVASITQPIGDDPTGQMVESILVAFDAYQSRENAKHTLRAMSENARQGFWNGSRPPFGFRAVEAERRGARTKKVLVIDEAEAALVRRIYALYLGAKGHPIGVKAIANELNDTGERYRGKPFAISNVHRVLTSETYVGRHRFNTRDSRTGQDKPASDWVQVRVPAIIDEEMFERVRARLAAHNPRRTPPRIVSGPTLLTGLAVCASCGGGMTLRTGKHGRYRYYTCARRAQKSVRLCAGCTVPMERLDRRVIDALAERVFEPTRLRALLVDHLDRARGAEADRRQHLARQKAQLTEVEGALARLVDAVERGLLDLADPELKPRLESLRARRAALREEITHGAPPPAQSGALTEQKLARLSAEMTGMLHDGPPALRRAHLRLFVDRVSVAPDQIRVSGPTAVLARAATAPTPANAGEVLTFVREWRP